MESKKMGVDDVNRHFLEKLMSYVLPLAEDAATIKILNLMEGYKFGLSRTGGISEEGAQRLDEILNWLKECAALEKSPPSIDK